MISQGNVRTLRGMILCLWEQRTTPDSAFAAISRTSTFSSDKQTNKTSMTLIVPEDGMVRRFLKKKTTRAGSCIAILVCIKTQKYLSMRTALRRIFQDLRRYVSFAPRKYYDVRTADVFTAVTKPSRMTLT